MAEESKKKPTFGRQLQYDRKYLAGVDVLTAARERMRGIFDIADEHAIRPVVSFSGGKDSTVVLGLALEEAARRDYGPVDVYFFDEEIHDPDTLALVEQLAHDPRLRFHWLCVPIRHTLRSNHRDVWFPWDPDEAMLWFRDMPEQAVHDLPGFQKGKMHFEDAIRLYSKSIGYARVTIIVGIKTDESLNRYRTIVAAGSWMIQKSYGWYAKPIYDFVDTDVWKVIHDLHLPYSHLYDKMRMAGIALGDQRTSSFGNVASARQNWKWEVLYPDLWEKTILRLPEMKSQARYGRTKLYRRGTEKPVGLTWQEWVFKTIESFEDETTKARAHSIIKRALTVWSRHFSIPYPEESITDQTGRIVYASWHHLAKVIGKNDLTSRDHLL